MKKMNVLNFNFSEKKIGITVGVSAAILTLILVVTGFFNFNQKQLKPTDKLIGLGAPVKKGQTVVIDYQAFIYDKKSKPAIGAVVDSTYARKQTRTLVLGEHQTIPGLEKALYGMRIGGQREVIIPAKDAYGSVEVAGGLVPPNSDLFYRIELRAVK